MASLTASRQLAGLTASTSRTQQPCLLPTCRSTRCRVPAQFSRSQSASRIIAISTRRPRKLCLRAWPDEPQGAQLSAVSTLPDVLTNLGDEQRQHLAAEWGYQQVGAPLPPGITPAVLTQSMPMGVAAMDLGRAALGAVAPLALMAAGYAWLWYMHSIVPGWQQALCWLLIGTGYFGLFTIAHDAARLALLPDDLRLQTVLGSLLMAPSLYSLEAWRVSLLIHYNQTNMLGEDQGGWQPLTKQRLATMGQTQRSWARIIATTPLKLLGSISHWLSSWGRFDLKRYFAPMRLNMIISWSVPFWFMGLVWPALISMGGLAAWFDCWFMPWIVFHLWLSTLTLLQHTAPHIPFEEPGPSYDAAQAIVSGTVTVGLPRWLEFIVNNANYHLPQHIYAGIPYYRAREATDAIKQKLGPYLTLADFNGRLLRNLIEQWQVYDEERKTYITFDQASLELQAAKATAH